MKKIVLITMLAMAASLFSSLQISVEASPLTDQVLARLATQYPSSVAGLDAWIKLKQNWDGGNKSSVIGQLAQTAAAVAGRNDIASIAAKYSTNSNITNTVQSAVQQEVEKRIGDQAKQYKNALDILGSLLKSGKLTPPSVMNNSSLDGAPRNWKKMLELTSTAYAPGVKDNGKWNNLTYIGTNVRKGVAAVDPTVIPMGTKLWIEGYGEAIAEDQGSAIKGNRIDLAFNSRQEALDYGIKNTKVYVLE
ncbi:MAG: hypothetical protein H6Q73_516 [Firmicutes bacterium]|nr:hypothetical protein [Bacillota bacterium]